MKFTRYALAVLAAQCLFAHAAAAPVFFSDRTSFVGAVHATRTDDFSSYGATSGSSVSLSNAAMSAVFGETRYESRSFSDLNLVGDVYAYGDGTNYCAGCNGNFLLSFDSTTFSVSGGVYGIGLDIVFHTSRRSSLGDILPGDTSLPGSLLIEFVDGSTQTVAVPEDVGFFGPEVHFLGIVDSRGIRSLTVGTEPLAQRHSWVIDNLTIAQGIPEPSSLPLLVTALIGALAMTRFRPGRPCPQYDPACETH